MWLPQLQGSCILLLNSDGQGRPLQPEEWQVSETLLLAIYRHMWGGMPESVAMLWQCMCCVPKGCHRMCACGCGGAENTRSEYTIKIHRRMIFIAQ